MACASFSCARSRKGNGGGLVGYRWSVVSKGKTQTAANPPTRPYAGIANDNPMPTASPCRALTATGRGHLGARLACRT